MANCANHDQVPAAAYCRTCGKPLCDSCVRTVHGVIYCEECLAARMESTGAAATPPPPRAPGAPNPTLAAILGFIPGVGAFYNGQYQKGVLHVLIFSALVSLADRMDFFGIFVAMFFFYMVVDAYKTAQAKERGEPVPDFLGFGRMFGNAEKPFSATFGDMSAAGVSIPSYSNPVQPRQTAPTGAIILIVVGLLFLLGNLGAFPTHFFRTFWPVILIALGLWKGYQRFFLR